MKKIKRIDRENAELISNFEKLKSKNLKEFESEMKILKSKSGDLSNELKRLEETPIELKKLPQAQEISAEMRELNAEWERLNQKMIGDAAINKNNAKNQK